MIIFAQVLSELLFYFILSSIIDLELFFAMNGEGS